MAKDMLVLPPEPVITEQAFNIKDCIDFFEGGAENVYLVDSNGSYRWRSAKRTETRLSMDDKDRLTLSFTPLAPVVFDSTLPLKADELEHLMQVGKSVFDANPDVIEFPVVNAQGEIISLLKRTAPKQEKLDWLKMDPHINGVALMPKGKIYLSSLKSKLLSDFYDIWNSRLDIELLTEKNINVIFNADVDSTLIYDCDIFADIPKISIRALYDKVLKFYLNFRAERWYVIQDTWSDVSESNIANLSLLVNRFDAGHEAVYVHGQDGRYKGTINLEPFRHRFPNIGCNETEVIFAPYSGSTKQDKYGIVEMLEAKSYREGALLKDGKVAASVCLIQDAGGMNKRAMWEKQHACWELIHDETANAFFGQRRRVFLSSDAGDLQGFQQRFGQMLDIYVYDGNNIDMYLNEQVDMLIYGEDMWPRRDKVPKYSARQLYADLLVEDMRRYFQAHDIAYYCCNLSRPVEDQGHRVVVRSVGEVIPPFVWTGLAEDYMAPAEYTGGGKVTLSMDTDRMPLWSMDIYAASICMVRVRFWVQVQVLVRR